MVLRKMLNNKWMVSCLLVGSILACAMISSIPMYTDGVTQRMMRRDLQILQNETGQYSGWINMTANLRSGYTVDQYKANYDAVDQMIRENLEDVQVPLLASYHRMSFDASSGYFLPKEEGAHTLRTYRVDAFSGMEQHVKVLDGRLPSDQVTAIANYDAGAGEVIENARFLEAVITKQAANERQLSVGMKIDMQSRMGVDAVGYQVEIVGIVEMDFGDGLYWQTPEADLRYSLLLNYDAMLKEFSSDNSMYINYHEWGYAYDYQAMTLSTMPALRKAMDNIADYTETMRGFEANLIAHSTLNTYLSRVNQLQLTLLVLEVPIIIMLAFYIFMVSQLIIDYERNEISVIKSRGGNNSQVLTIYLLQSLVISGIALVIGPFISMLLCGIIGASDGFLSFVSRVGLQLRLSGPVYLYSMAALLFSIITMLLPAFVQSRRSIVEHKQSRARTHKTPLWKRLGLDFILLAISIYGIFFYRNYNLAMRSMTQASATAMPIDPFLFVISMLFVLGAGLLAIRLYPLLVSFIFWLGRKRWNATMYATFATVGRSRGNEQFLMLFLVLTISIGLFSANAARTINYNQEARLRYKLGADLIVETEWRQTTKYINAMPDDLIINDNGTVSIRDGADVEEKKVWVEIPDNLFDGVAGTEHVAHVMIPETAGYYRGTATSAVPLDNFMAIEPYDFGQVAYDPPLIYGQYHWYHYLNLLTEYEYGVVISDGFAEQYGLKSGDFVNLNWNGGEPLEFMVLATVDYWPTFNPYAVVDEEAEEGTEAQKPVFAIANIDFIYKNRDMEPYQIWISRAEGATTAEIYADIAAKELPVLSIVNGMQELTTMQNDPMLQGANGSMTLCFLMTLIVSAIGFIIYWVLSIRSRALQFGIFRAIGLKMRDVFIMLITEQLLISGAAVLMGLLIGTITSELYVPLLEIVYSFANQAPDFVVVTQLSDHIKIYIFIAALLLAGCGLLAWLVKRIKITQAIKLGEE